MKKILVSLLLTALIGFASTAQTSIFDNPDNEAYFGIRVGGEVTCPGKFSADNVGVSVYNIGGGVEFGGIYNIPVVANFYIEPGLMLYYNVYSMKKDFVEAMQDDVAFNSVSVKKFGFRIPVMAGYHFDFTEDIRVSVFTGPELEICLLEIEYMYCRIFDVS